MHKAIGDFTVGWRGAYDASAEARMREVGAAVLAEIAEFPDVHAIWSHRFTAIARWLVAWEAARSSAVADRHAEIDGELELATPIGPFRLRGRADRIDVRHDGRVDILDYKTGTPPSAKEVLQGFAPQLALEAGMVRRGAFGEALATRAFPTSPGSASAGSSGESRSSPRSRRHGPPTGSPIASWSNSSACSRPMPTEPFPYRSRARPKFQQRYESPYDHLARFHEWALGRGRRGFLAVARAGKTVVLDRATEAAQADATNPVASAWVSANAGSGKTFVLSQPRRPPAARRRRSGAHPLPHLHQGGRGRDGQARLRASLAAGRRLTTRSLPPRSPTIDGRRRRIGPAARSRPPPVRQGAGDAGRPEDPDHPRLLRAAAPSVSLRGQCRRPFRGARRAQPAAT